ncbi:hypothetical protein HYU95_00625 [Candidatus Daviesbacteria bacterium]|nr:hypothetical protein [Candidatus Daviesbacteria bacterium]
MKERKKEKDHSHLLLIRPNEVLTLAETAQFVLFLRDTYTTIRLLEQKDQDVIRHHTTGIQVGKDDVRIRLCRKDLENPIIILKAPSSHDPNLLNKLSRVLVDFSSKTP